MSLFDMLSYAFMQRAVVCGLAIGIVCGVMSCWVTHIGWSLMGDAISHAVLPGVVLSYLLDLPYLIGALIAGIVAVGLIGEVRKIRAVRPDTAMGVVFATLFSLGTVLISKIPSQVNLTHILFGNLLGVTPLDLYQVLILGAIVLLVLVIRHKDITLFCFDPSHAQAIGINPKRIEWLLLLSLAVTVVIALQAVGVILSVSMLIVPGVTARLFTANIWKMLWLSPLLSCICVLVGIAGSYVFDASSGGAIGLSMGIMFAIAYVVAPYGLRSMHNSRKQKETKDVPETTDVLEKA